MIIGTPEITVVPDGMFVSIFITAHGSQGICRVTIINTLNDHVGHLDFPDCPEFLTHQPLSMVPIAAAFPNPAMPTLLVLFAECDRAGGTCNSNPSSGFGVQVATPPANQPTGPVPPLFCSITMGDCTVGDCQEHLATLQMSWETATEDCMRRSDAQTRINSYNSQLQTMAMLLIGVLAALAAASAAGAATSGLGSIVLWVLAAILAVAAVVLIGQIVMLKESLDSAQTDFDTASMAHEMDFVTWSRANDTIDQFCCPICIVPSNVRNPPLCM